MVFESLGIKPQVINAHNEIWIETPNEPKPFLLQSSGLSLS